MSTWNRISATKDGGKVDLLDTATKKFKSVDASSVSSQLQAVIDDIISHAKRSNVSKEYKYLEITTGIGAGYLDINGKSISIDGSVLDTSKIDALAEAIDSIQATAQVTGK